MRGMAHRMTETKPKAIFKYLPPNLISVLQNLLIRFSQASSLNDTLELRPPVKGVAAHATLTQIGIEKLAPTMWLDASVFNPEIQKQKEMIDKICPGLSDLVAENLLQETSHKFADAVMVRHEKNPSAVFDKTDKNFGILSLTETPTDVRMWGYYGDGGRGFLIEFDPGHAWFHAKREDRDSFRSLRKVNYVSSRPAKYLLDVSECEFLYTKWNAWRDEQEWRIIRCFSDAKKKLGEVDFYGNEIFLFEIPPSAIKSVILGFSASHESEEKIQLALKENQNLAHVVMKYAVQSAETGEVSIM